MSCSLTPVSGIVDVNKISTLLSDPSQTQQEVEKSAEQDASSAGDWEWGGEGAFTLDTSGTEGQDSSWLNDCCIALSPTEELLALGRDRRAVFLARKWDASAQLQSKGVYEVVWNGILPTEEGECITSLLCIPLASQQRSSHGAPDWTCVVAGFTSGCIRMYMPNGSQLLSQFLHDDPVTCLKMRTKSPGNVQDSSEQTEELLILYPKAAVVIDGFSLYQSLRACRNQLARAQASRSSEAIQPPPLAYRKWRFNGQQLVMDFISCGLVTPSLFDRLDTASFLSGPNASVKGSSPAFNHFISCGSNPFLGVFEALEGSSPPIISEVAMAVASKLTSAVFSSITAASGWFRLGGWQKASTAKDPKNEKPKVEKGTSLPIRYGLPDKRRHAYSLVLSPCGHLAACTDDFGRVLLIDSAKGVVIRMLKGYRDAECGWLVVKEEKEDFEENKREKEKENLRRALFLVVYAPRRGILEIWLTEQGGRVGAFSVGKDCRLLYQGYESLGKNPILENQRQNSSGSSRCFLMHTDGQIKEIHVPFHCSLSTIHSVRARDLHLLKKLASLLDKSFSYVEQGSTEELVKSVTNLLLEIQIPATQMKGVQCILSCTKLSPVLLKMCLLSITNLSKQANIAEDEDLEFEAGRQDLRRYCQAHLHLVETYISIYELNNQAEGPDAYTYDESDKEKVLAEVLHITDSEAADLTSSIEKYCRACLHNKKKSEGANKVELVAIANFLSCFDIEEHEKESEDAGSSKSSPSVKLKENLSRELSIQLGSFFYKDALTGRSSISKLTFLLDSSGIPPKQLMNLLVLYSQSEYGSLVLQFPNCLYLRFIVSSLCFLKGGPEKETADMKASSVSSWWEPIRKILADSTAIGQCLLMAVVCRSVAMELVTSAQKIKEKDESELSSGSWVDVTIEMENWNLLIQRIDDLLELDCFVHTNHTLDENCRKGIFLQPKECFRNLKLTNSGASFLDSPFSLKNGDRHLVLSVKGIEEGGHGAIAQVSAACLVRQGVPGPCLGKPKLTKKKRVGCNSGTPMDVELQDDLPDTEEEATEELQILEALAHLRERFPYSLQQDILWAHCCWECIMTWKDDAEEIPILSSALVHLSCIHCSLLQQGLASMMWKTVYRDSVKTLLHLTEKVGKAPKDRLCRKTLGMSYGAIEKFLETGQKLLELLNQVDVDENDEITFEEETHWKRPSSSIPSVAEKAVEEPVCNKRLVEHFWCLIVVLRLIMITGMKSIKPLSIFDTKGKHGFGQSLHGSLPATSEVDESIVEARNKFCSSVLTLLIKKHISSVDEETTAEENGDFLRITDNVFNLCRQFGIDEDIIWQHYACELYSAGLDLQGYEASLSVHDKEVLAEKLLRICGPRLAFSLLEAKDTLITADLFSKLPTQITSWLQNQDISKIYVSNISLSKNLQLLSQIMSYTPEHAKMYKFIRDLVESLKGSS